MAKLRKSWRQKLADDKGLPRVVVIDEKAPKQWGTGTIAIPAPSEVRDIMAMVPRGKLLTTTQIREVIARRHGATMGCPMTTGLLCQMVAGAAEEDAAEGRRDITPYWRTLRAGGELNPKYPSGVEVQAAYLEAEGHTIDRRRKTPRVADYEKALVEP